MLGDLNVSWIHGAANCAETANPPIQVHRFDADTFILRQSKCSDPGPPGGPAGPSFEAPFLYLLVGSRRALLVDSGASRSPAVFPIAETVDRLLLDRAATTAQPRLPLIVAHTHSHGDHAAGDVQLAALDRTTIVPLGVAGVKEFFGLADWPDDAATIDLGNRVLDVLPIPGHEASHVAFYDRATQFLLTGDTFYPGLLVVNDWNAYRRSAAKLKAFAGNHPVSLLLGAHIEMTRQPGRWFGLGRLFQPDEHVLELRPQHLQEWADSVEALGPSPRTQRHGDFIIFPASDPLPPLAP
ncbi:MAG: MBL fold metallo-hydrolase [Pirellulales bacterium]